MCSRADFGGNAKAGRALSGGCVALTFENERVVYDPEEERLRFFAVDGVLLVQCGISKAALTALENTRSVIRTRLSRPISTTAISSRILWSGNTAHIGLRPA